MEITKYLQYNSTLILSYFFISLGVLILSKITNKQTDTLLFSSYRSSIFNPLTYIIVLSSFVNIETGKIPLTLILIFIFYIVNEILDGLFKKDRVSHLGHLIGAICGCVFGFYFM